jgi:hypothetical protein
MPRSRRSGASVTSASTRITRASSSNAPSSALILEGVMPDPEDLVARVQSFMAEAAEKRSLLIL